MNHFMHIVFTAQTKELNKTDITEAEAEAESKAFK